jgi:hypothetical protein
MGKDTGGDSKTLGDPLFCDSKAILGWFQSPEKSPKSPESPGGFERSILRFMLRF